ncbi:MAG: adenylate/guanylate cyclase domain-containing protein [Leptospiraceae bacterium]|nr:adenylate/guanylate cyclase domain-containing protein [Leptospiraceae bacterium]
MKLISKVMKKDESNPFLKFSILYFGFTFFSNLLVQLLLWFFINKVLFTQEEIILFEKSFSEYNFLTQFGSILSFFVPTLLTIVYLSPIYKLMTHKTDDEKIIATAKTRMLRLPIVSIQISLVGWSIGLGFALLLFFYLQSINDFETFLRIYIVNLLVLLMLLGFIYFLTDLLNRQILIPKYFNETEIENLPQDSSIRLYYRFLIYFSSICIIPMILFTNIIFNLKMNRSFDFNLSSVIMIDVCILFLGFYLTKYILSTISSPIESIYSTIQSIKDGDYTKTIPITSNDEIGFLSSGINSMSKSLLEKEFIKDTFGKLVDPRIRDIVLANGLGLKGEEREVTILFVDIRGFTGISEILPPTELLEWLNNYFQEMSDCIREKNGIVNKFIGDAILAFFGFPIIDPNHAYNAVETARMMRTRLIKLNQDLKLKNLPEIKIGIGIHTGKATLGNVGSKERLEYTVIGDTVNIASRIESLCKQFQEPILFSETTASKVPESEKIFLGDEEIRGREKKIGIYKTNII